VAPRLAYSAGVVLVRLHLTSYESPPAAVKIALLDSPLPEEREGVRPQHDTRLAPQFGKTPEPRLSPNCLYRFAPAGIRGA
jgi:hypothetical protein